MKQKRIIQSSRMLPALLLLGLMGFFIACTDSGIAEVEQETANLKEISSSVPPPPPPPAIGHDQETDVYKVVEEMPRFPGCEDVADLKERKNCAQKKLLTYVYENIKYPEEAKQANVSGMVVISFVIDKEGRVTEPEIVRNVGAGTGEEALRAVKKMNEDGIRWIPGQEDGKAVKVQFNLPVKFALE